MGYIPRRVYARRPKHIGGVVSPKNKFELDGHMECYVSAWLWPSYMRI